MPIRLLTIFLVSPVVGIRMWVGFLDFSKGINHFVSFS